MRGASEMSNDQAQQLRQLAEQTVGKTPVASAQSIFWVVAGAKGGVGCRTTAQIWAEVLAKQGEVVALMAESTASIPAVDDISLAAIPQSASQTKWTVRILNSRAESTGENQTVPSATGFPENIVSALRGSITNKNWTLSSRIIIISLGARRSSVDKRLWQTAAGVLLVTAPDFQSVMDAYASIKLLAPNDQRVFVLVNRAARFREANQAFRLLSSACQRFLHRQIQLAGIARECFSPASRDSSDTNCLDAVRAELAPVMDRFTRIVRAELGCRRWPAGVFARKAA